MQSTNQRVVNILTAIFETPENLAEKTGIEPKAAEQLMANGEFHFDEFIAIKQTLGLQDERMFFDMAS